MSLGRNARDAQFPNLHVNRDAVVGNDLRSKYASCCYLHATSRSRHASMTVDPLSIDAVIGPAGTSVPDGSTRFDTLQDAVAYADAFTGGDVVLNVPAGDYTAEGVISTSNASSTSSLHISGPRFDYHGKSYVDGHEIAGAWTGSGSGVATITVVGASVAVTAGGANPDFQTTGVRIGDQIVVWLETGVVDGVYSVTSVAPTVLSLNAAPTVPVTAGQGYGFAFVPSVHVAGYNLADRQGDVNIENHYLPSPDASGYVVTADNCRVFVVDTVVHRSNLACTDNALHFADSKVPYVELRGSALVANRGMGVSHGIRGRVVDSVLAVPVTGIGAGEALSVGHGARVMINGRVVMLGVPSNAMIELSDGAHLMTETNDDLHVLMQLPAAGGLAPALSMRNVALASLGSVHVERYDTYAVPASYSMHLQGSSKLHVQNLQSTLNNGVPAVNTGSHVYANTDSSVVVQAGTFDQGRYGLHGEGHAHLVGTAALVDNTDTLAVMVGSNAADGGTFAAPRTNVADGTAVLQGGVRYVV